MGVPPENDREAISGFDSLHRVAQSYLGPLWIVADTREGGQGALRLLRRLSLPEGTSAEARAEIAELGRKAMQAGHPNVLRVLEVIEQGESLALLYEHAEAEPLRSLQSWANLRGLSFPVGVSLRISVDLLQGLAALHEMAARDPGLCASGGLSPDSVLVSRDGLTQLGDPLIASGAALLEGIGFNTAKLAYAAPEQVRPTKPPSAQADSFTCAAMLWELLASRRLLAGSRPAIERKLLDHSLPSLKSSLKTPGDVSDELIALVERALSADPSERPADAHEFARQLGGSGHPLASSTDVAAFIGKLSGPRFERRTAAIRSRSSGSAALGDVTLPSDAASGPPPSTQRHPASDIETPRAAPNAGETSAAPASVPRPWTDAASAPLLAPAAPFAPTPSSLRRAAAATPRADEPPPPSSARAPATAAFAPAPVEPPRLGLAPDDTHAGRGAALWEQMVAPAAPVTRPPTIPPPLDGNTLALESTLGSLGNAKPAQPDDEPAFPEFGLPRASRAGEESRVSAPLLSDPFMAGPPVVPLDPHAASARQAGAAAAPDGPLPFEHLLRRSKRASAPPTSLSPDAQSLFSLRASPAAGTQPARRLPARSTVVALVLGTLALVAASSWWLLGSRPNPSVATVAEPPRAAEPIVPAEVPEAPAPLPAEPEAPRDEPPAPTPAANVAPASMKAPDAPPDGALPPGASEPPPATDAPQAQASDFAAPKLDDSQLVVLLALEAGGPAATCAERLGTAEKPTGKDMRLSQQQAKAARRQLDQGDVNAGHELACSAVAHHPGNAQAQRSLADAALRLGDPAQAKAAVDVALSLAPKDKSLMALRGDILALMGDIGGARAMWLRTGPARGSKATRTKRLVTAYRKAGDKALASSDWADAATYFRRAVVLTNGSFVPSLGLSEALLGMDRSRAGLVWAERAAQAFPKDSRIQVLFGDALYENGQAEKARTAWQTALDVQPTNRVAARRLREGKP